MLYLLLRFGPDSSQHVPDCSDQPRPGQPSRSGGHGARRHTHRKHSHTGRPGGGGCDLGAVTLWTLEGAESTEPWRICFSPFPRQHIMYNVGYIFKCVHLQLKYYVVDNALCLLCKDIAFVGVFFSYFLALWCWVFSIYFLTINPRRTKKPGSKATTASLKGLSFLDFWHNLCALFIFFSMHLKLGTIVWNLPSVSRIPNYKSFLHFTWLFLYKALYLHSLPLTFLHYMKEVLRWNIILSGFFSLTLVHRHAKMCSDSGYIHHYLVYCCDCWTAVFCQIYL